MEEVAQISAAIVVIAAGTLVARLAIRLMARRVRTRHRRENSRAAFYNATCPACHGRVQQIAIVCRHCLQPLPKVDAPV